MPLSWNLTVIPHGDWPFITLAYAERCSLWIYVFLGIHQFINKENVNLNLIKTGKGALYFKAGERS